MKILHKLAHWLDIYSSFVDVYVENDYVCIGRRCNTCGKVENVRRMWPEKETPDIIKILGRNK